ELRTNTFLQQWSPNTKKLSNDLKAIASAPKKFGVRLEGLAFSVSMLRSLPIWDTVNADSGRLGHASRKSQATTCLQKNHKILTVGQCCDLADRTRTPEHRPTRTCTCTACAEMVTDERCANPHRCYTKAKQLLDLLHPKWDPRAQTRRSEDEYVDQALYSEDGQEHTCVDTRVVTGGTVAEAFRIFTEGETSKECIPPKSGREVEQVVVVATDGSCVGNGQTDAVAGAGVFFGHEDRRNVSMRLPQSIGQTNQAAEETAILLAARNVD
ncbi:hypothetical protein FKP32DRAFT_1532785, partial [Trametes sanguinea]